MSAARIARRQVEGVLGLTFIGRVTGPFSPNSVKTSFFRNPL